MTHLDKIILLFKNLRFTYKGNNVEFLGISRSIVTKGGVGLTNNGQNVTTARNIPSVVFKVRITLESDKPFFALALQDEMSYIMRKHISKFFPDFIETISGNIKGNHSFNELDGFPFIDVELITDDGVLNFPYLPYSEQTHGSINKGLIMPKKFGSENMKKICKGPGTVDFYDITINYNVDELLPDYDNIVTYEDERIKFVAGLKISDLTFIINRNPTMDEMDEHTKLILDRIISGEISAENFFTSYEQNTTMTNMLLSTLPMGTPFTVKTTGAITQSLSLGINLIVDENGPSNSIIPNTMSVGNEIYDLISDVDDIYFSSDVYVVSVDGVGVDYDFMDYADSVSDAESGLLFALIHAYHTSK